MIRLATRLVAHDLRADPLSAAAITLLLAVAGALPAVFSTSVLAGLVLAGVVAATATVGAVAAHGHRRSTLELNGAGDGVGVLVAAGSMVGPGLVATLSATVVAVAWGDGAPLVTAPVVCLVVPLVVATAVCRAAGERDAPHQRRKWNRVGWALVWVPLLLVTPILFIPLSTVVIARAIERHGRGARAAVMFAAAAVSVLVAATVGRTETWFDLTLALLVLGPLLVVAVGRLGTTALDAAGAVARRLGSRARLASAPLVLRRRALGPVAAVLAVVVALAALEGTVGASFGRREALRRAAGPTVVGVAGTTADQAIGVVSPAEDPAAVHLVAADVAPRRGARATVIDRLGDGGTPSRSGDTGFNPFLIEPTVAVAGTGLEVRGPIWIGVIDPADMAALGVGDLADELAAGQLVVLNPTLTDGGRIRAAAYATAVEVPDGALPSVAVTAPGRDVPALLPGGLISPAVAAGTGVAVRPGRIVMTSGPDRPLDREALRAAAGAVVDRTVPDGSPSGSGDSTLDLVRVMERDAKVRLGDDAVDLGGDGPLNDVPGLSATRDEARGRMATLALLAALVTVAGVALALGATRTEDAVLWVQGAPEGTRASLGAIQALVLSGAASVLAAIVGIGLPALAFSVYNGSARGDLPPIPLVVPWEVAVGLVALPLASALLAAAVVAARRPSAAGRAGPSDDLAW